MDPEPNSQQFEGDRQVSHTPVIKDDDATESYQYEPLPAPHFMRLLNVESSWNFHEPILCSMEVVDPANCGEYSALSYSWGMNADGDASFCRQITIDGKVKPVTRNLFEGLRRLRMPEDSLRIWIDAVCINQVDAVERSAQVATMATKFANAAKLLVWLGEGTSKEQDWFIHTTIDYFLHIRLKPDWRICEAQSPPIPSPRLLVQMCSAITEFLERRYFTRLWIVQEIKHARKSSTSLFWGSCNIPRDSFDHFLLTYYWNAETIWDCIEKMGEQRQEALSIPYHLGHIFSDRQDDYEPFSLLPDLVVLCHGRLSCADPRDRLYALVSLAPDFGLEPDYTVCLETLLVRFATMLVNKRLAHYILSSFPPPDYRHGLALPTWVPDLCQLGDPLMVDIEGLDMAVNYDGILTYNPYLLGTVLQRREADERPCIVRLDVPTSASAEHPQPRANNIDLNRSEFDMAEVDDLICVVPLRYGLRSIVQIVRKATQGVGVYYWVSKFVLWDKRFKELWHGSTRVTLNIV